MERWRPRRLGAWERLNRAYSSRTTNSLIPESLARRLRRLKRIGKTPRSTFVQAMPAAAYRPAPAIGDSHLDISTPNVYATRSDGVEDRASHLPRRDHNAVAVARQLLPFVLASVAPPEVALGLIRAGFAPWNLRQ